MSFQSFVPSPFEGKGSPLPNPFPQGQSTGLPLSTSDPFFDAPRVGYGSPSTSLSTETSVLYPSFSPTGTATYPITTIPSYSPVQSQFFQAPSSPPSYSSTGSFSVQTPSQTSGVDRKKYSPTYFSLPSPVTSPLRALPPSPVRGLLSPVGSPGMKGKAPDRTVENRDFSEWGLSLRDFNTNLLALYKNRFLLIYKRLNGKYKAVWAPGRLLRGDQLLSTAREASIRTIIDSPLIDGYPYNLEEEAVEGNVIAAISSLDEKSLATYLSMGDTTINLIDLTEYLKISRLIGDKALIDALAKDVKTLGEFESNSSKNEMQDIRGKIEAGINPLTGAVSRIVEEKVNLPAEYISPLSTGSREDFISAFRDGVRAYPIVTGTFSDDSKENYDDLISILSGYKAITPGLFKGLLSSGRHPRLIRNPTLWKHLRRDDWKEAMASLSLLEASDLLSLPLKEVDLSSPYIFNLDDVPKIAQNIIEDMRGEGTYLTTDELARLVGRYLYVDEGKHGQFDTSKLDRLLIDLPLENSAITGALIGSTYDASLRGTAETVADTFPRSQVKYSLIPITTNQVGEEKAAYMVSRLDLGEGESINDDYFFLKGSEGGGLLLQIYVGISHRDYQLG